MKLFDFFSRNRDAPSANTAKQRLQVMVTLDREGGPDFLPLMQREIMEVIRKYVEIDDERVAVDFNRGPGFSTLEVNVELPNGGKPQQAVMSA